MAGLDTIEVEKPKPFSFWNSFLIHARLFLDVTL